MTVIDDKSSVLTSASLSARTALVAECGSRVLPIYEEYWTGVYSDRVKRGVAMVWQAASGAEVDLDAAEQIRSALEDLVTYYRTEGAELLGDVVTVVLRAVTALSPDPSEAVLATAQTLLAGLAVAQRAEIMANRAAFPNATRNDAVLEEQDWQAKATRIAVQWTGPADRSMFTAAGPARPGWHDRWLRETSAQR